MRRLLILIALISTTGRAQDNLVTFSIVAVLEEDSLELLPVVGPAFPLINPVNLSAWRNPPDAVEMQDLGLRRIPRDSVDTWVPRIDFSDNHMRRFRWPTRMVRTDTLYLSGNRMRRFEPKISLFSVEVLDLSDNRLNQERVSGITGVPEINLSGNHFTDLQLRYHARTLRRLDVSRNMLRRVPGHLNYMRHLEYLDLSSNQITSLSSGMSKLKNLRYLDVSDNGLRRIPSSFRRLDNLEVLDVTGNPLKEGEVERIESMLPEGCQLLHD